MTSLPVDPARFAAFLSVMVVMVVTPGPANLFAIATGAAKGKAGAVMAMLGMTCGTLVWSVGAAMGLSALVLAWPAVFRWMVYGGAAFVAWLGLKSLWSAWRPDAGSGHAPIRLGPSAFRDGFAVQISNPKALLFFTGVLPPFLDPARPLIPQIVVLVGSVIWMDMIAMVSYGLGGAALAARMEEPRFRRIFAAFVGVLLMTTAAMMLLHR